MDTNIRSIPVICLTCGSHDFDDRDAPPQECPTCARAKRDDPDGHLAKVRRSRLGTTLYTAECPLCGETQYGYYGAIRPACNCGSTMNQSVWDAWRCRLANLWA